MILLENTDCIAIEHLFELYGEKIKFLLDCHVLERIKGISFLGVTSTLFQKKDSTRFSHSINVAYLASLIAKNIKFLDEERNILVLYYLFHDIGHLPNSHVTEPLLRLLKIRYKFHDSLGLYMLDSDLFAKNWVCNNIKNGEWVWERIRDIFRNDFTLVNNRIREIIKSPINPDTIEGIYRSASILDIKNIFLEEIVEGIFSDEVKHNIFYSKNHLKYVFDFFELQKNIYNNYIFSIANQSAEAMWKKALLLAIEKNAINIDEDLFNLSEEDLIHKIQSVEKSRELLENIRLGNCLTPYWVNNHPNLMDNEFAQISNKIYSKYSVVTSLEKKIYTSVAGTLQETEFVALHFNRLRQFSTNWQGVLFDIPFMDIKSFCVSKKTQGIIPLSIFGYPFVKFNKIDKPHLPSQKAIDDLLMKLFSEEAANIYKSIVIVAPMSPNDTNPPAGPLLLKSYAKEKGVNIAIADLNIKFINTFEGVFSKSLLIGDHCKSTKVEKAAFMFSNSIQYPNISLIEMVNCIDNSKSFPFTFQQIDTIIDNELNNNNFWLSFFDKYFFNCYEKVNIVGFSIMGTTQLILSMLLSKLIKMKWKDTITVAGGTHITLKRNHLISDKQYGNYFDYYLPFHCEHVYLECITKNINDINGVIKPGISYVVSNNLNFKGYYPLALHQDEFVDYNEELRCIPIQVGIGCNWGECTMCTYNFIEGYNNIDFKEKLKILLTGLNCNIAKNISFKDSNITKFQLRTIATHLQGFSFKWNASTCVSSEMTLNDFKYLNSSGCINLEIGVETIHPHIQNVIGKVYPIKVIEEYISNAIEAGISIVINLIYGFPTESKEDAINQLKWFNVLKNKYQDKLYGSHNMLEINQGSKIANNPHKYDVILGDLKPWAFSFPWNSPKWRSDFKKLLDDTITSRIDPVSIKTEKI